MLKNRVAVITDSIACIPRDLLDNYSIGIIPLNFYINGKVYRDGVDITPSEAYQLFLKDPGTFKTSGASPGACLDAFHQALHQSKSIFAVIISSQLSALFSTAEAAGKQAQMEFPGTSVVVMDSLTAAAAEGLIALSAAQAANAGMSLVEVQAIAEKIREKVKVVAYMDTVRHIYRSGRIPKIASVAGSMLKIKPIFTFANGVPRFMGAVRSKNMGIERILDDMRAQVGNRQVHVAVMHVYAEEDAIQLKKRVASEFNCTELWLTEFSPLMGYACGTGTLGLAFYPED